MKKLLEMLTEEMQQAFTVAGYDGTLGKVMLSNRPDLCEYQCNGAMAGAKLYKKAPIMIANDVAEKLADSKVFSEAVAVAPGFLNLKVSESFLLTYLQGMEANEKFGLEKPEHPKKIIIDYGGPNVAKPLHVGHLRSAVIGESVKRISRYVGHEVIGDVHLGDWGLQMGLVITGLQERQPDLVYLMRTTPGNIPKRHRLPSANWRRSIPQPAPGPRRIPSTRQRRWKRPSNCRAVSEDIVPCGSTLSMCL